MAGIILPRALPIQIAVGGLQVLIFKGVSRQMKSWLMNSDFGG